MRINRIRLEFKEVESRYRLSERRKVLIESDWNLKSMCWLNLFSRSSINRIRLEFKVDIVSNDINESVVLIESDWNLKESTTDTNIGFTCINRIILEFKDYLII